MHMPTSIKLHKSGLSLLMKPALTSDVQLNGLCLHGRHGVHSVNNACCASLFAIIFMEIEKIACE